MHTPAHHDYTPLTDRMNALLGLAHGHGRIRPGLGVDPA